MAPTPGKDALARVRAAVGEELRLIAEDALDRAKQKISISPPPGIDPAPAVALRASGTVGRVRRRGNHMTISVGFHATYAAVQEIGRMSYEREGHSGRIFWQVRNHPGGGQTRYLESTIKEMAADYDRRLAHAARRALGG
jgi:hypothetical protein